MVDIGNHIGRQTMAVISDMNQPLGYAVGNALEVMEAINTLRGKGPEDLTALTLTLASHMLVLAGLSKDVEGAKQQVQHLLDTGAAIDKLKEWVRLQGGDEKAVDDFNYLPQAKYSKDVYLEKLGYVKAIDAEAIGRAALVLGAGRETKESQIGRAHV